MIKRPHAMNLIKQSLKRSRVVALLGPRQCGKTTLARAIVPADSFNYFDLEDPVSLGLLNEPLNRLSRLKGIVVIDEIQRRPDLFPILRVLADRKPLTARFLILGSASPDLVRHSSESLAGRLESIHLSGFDLSEVGLKHHETHWRRGGFPLSFLARSEEDSLVWRKNFVQTYLERDLPQLSVNVPSTTLHRFWSMLAHYHGQIWNAADPARSLGIGETSVRRYLDLLTGVFMIRQLPPWHANLKKRQVKAPKIYFRDTGLLHSMLGIHSEKDLLMHPKFGASWEGYVVEEIHKAIDPDESYFWATHNGAELDLLVVKNGEKIGIEIKRSDVPQLTTSMSIAINDLKLKHLVVIYPGTRRFDMSKNITALPVNILAQKQAPELNKFFHRF